MKPSVNRSNSATTKVLSKREEKKQIYIAWNPRIAFQLGLIAAMLLVFFIMNVSIQVDGPQSAPEPWVFNEPPMRDYDIEPDTPKPNVSPLSKPKTIAKTTPRVLQKVINVIPNNTPDTTEDVVGRIEMPTGTSKPSPKAPEVPKTGKMNTMKTVEFVPVFPGCEDLEGNFARQECMSRKIGAYITRKFGSDKFEGEEFAGKQRMFVQFTIDTHGLVTDVRANAAHESLKEEAIRIVANLPKMIPGLQGNTPVSVQYRIPIVFQFE